LTERDELVRRAPCGEDRCFELDDARGCRRRDSAG